MDSLIVGNGSGNPGTEQYRSVPAARGINSDNAASAIFVALTDAKPACPVVRDGGERKLTACPVPARQGTMFGVGVSSRSVETEGGSARRSRLVDP